MKLANIGRIMMVGLLLTAASPVGYAEEPTTVSTTAPDEAVDTQETVQPEATADQEASVDPQIMETTMVEDVAVEPKVMKATMGGQTPVNDVTKTSTKEAVTLFGLIGAIAFWLISYRIYVARKK